MDSGANITSSSGPPPTSPRSASVSTPVVHETPVIATGARENSGKRELFKESTTTALVFPNGGVIRLSAAVAPGQLLFLTNLQTKREVVAQVTRKRTNPSSGFYIELEFSEPAPGFWGIEFPENRATVPASPQPPSAVEYDLLHSAESAPDDLSPSAPAPTVAEVHALFDEVEALRAQLRSMQTQGAASADTPASPVPVSSSAPPLPAMLAAILNPSVAPQKNAVAPELRDSSAPPAASTLPVEAPPSGEEHPAPEENPLPEPELDFKKADAPKKNSPMNELKPAPGDRLGTLRLALLAAVSLFAVSIAAWNMHWLPWLSEPSTGASTPVRPAANPSSQARQAAPQKANAHPGPKAPTQVSVNSSSQPNNTAAPPTSTSTEVPPSDTHGDPVEATHAGSKPAIKKDSAPVVSVAKRSPAHPSPTAEASVSDDIAAIVPPRLLKSVKPIAPSDALRSFVTGNVVLDALIDKSGHVESMKVVSGPSSFHKAAMNALKQYRYEPARQHGKPVPAHITVTVPFLFEP